MAKEKKQEDKINAASSTNTHRALVEPLVTEYAHVALALNKYIFKVAKEARKLQIKKAIEDLYKVKVLSVHTINVPKKFRSYGRTPGWKSGYKKAVVTLKAGDKIELFEG